jgi:hypothetical protein
MDQHTPMARLLCSLSPLLEYAPVRTSGVERVEIVSMGDDVNARLDNRQGT